MPPCDLTYRRTKRLLIQCPTAVKTAYNAPNNLFEDNWLRVYAFPSDYTQVNNFLEGDAPGYQFGFNTVTFGMKLVQRGFKLTISESRSTLYYVLYELAALSYSTAYDQHVPLQVRDYIQPERQDVKTAIANETEPFTLRHGSIRLEDVKGSVGQRNNLYFPDKYTLDFTESRLRLI